MNFSPSTKQGAGNLAQYFLVRNSNEKDLSQESELCTVYGMEITKNIL